MPKEVGLPDRVFMYEIDQIAFILELDEQYVKRNLLHYDRRSVGAIPKDKMLAVDVSPDDAKRPHWRVSENSLKRWLRYKGWRIRERGYIT